MNEKKNSVTLKTQRAVELASEKGPSNWLTVIPIDEMGFTLNKGEFRDALKLRYDREIVDKPSICVCGDVFNVDHAMVWRRVTPTLILIETWTSIRYTNSTRMTRKDCIRKE